MQYAKSGLKQLFIAIVQIPTINKHHKFKNDITEVSILIRVKHSLNSLNTNSTTWKTSGPFIERLKPEHISEYLKVKKPLVKYTV